MQFLDNTGITDPRINLALEEYALRDIPSTDTFLLFYINEPSIIIGRHQNTIEEINAPYVEQQGIHVVRRISGGGAVYHDLGNLNFSFITNADGRGNMDFHRFTEPVMRVLRGLGVPAELSGRNDILVEGRKISGNAQYHTATRMFSHGTLLFDTNLDEVVHALTVKTGKIESKGLKSIRSRVANIREFLHAPMTIEEFRDILLRNLFNTEDVIPCHFLTEQDWERIHRLAEEKYSQWTWNYGSSPACDLHRSQRFAAGLVEARISVDRGLITHLHFFGDFFSFREPEELAARLVGTPYTRAALEKRLELEDINTHFTGLTKSELLQVLIEVN